MSEQSRRDDGSAVPPGVVLARATCLRRLRAAGVQARAEPEPVRPGVLALRAEAAATSGAGVDCELSSFPATSGLDDRLGGEAVAQALSGLMAVHGSDHDVPTPLGLEIASVTAGLLAAQGVLAALVGESRDGSRGGSRRIVRTSLLQAAALVASHYVAAATGSENPWPKDRAPAPGPPFCTADGAWVELETLDPAGWRSFWGQLGTPDAVLGAAWTRFRARYFSGTCTLPPQLHEATRRHPLASVEAAAAAYGVSLTPVRGYPDVLAGLDGWRGTPVVEPLPTLDGAVVEGVRPVGAARGLSALPLAGLVVVEATTRMQGPLAGLLLAMLGASVVKVEPPGGDIGRGMPPLAGEVGTFFRTFNRGKQTVEINLATSEGRTELVERVAGAEVFLHNWRPGRDREWSLRPADLALVNPGLVYAEASGWGMRPELDRVLGMDFLVQAYAGVGQGLRPPDEPPRTSRITLTDCLGALVTCEGILSGLFARASDGRGRHVRTSLLAGGVSLQAHVLDGLAGAGEVGRRGGRPLWGRLDRPIETTDDAVVLDVRAGADLVRAAAAYGIDVDEMDGTGVQGKSADLECRLADELHAGTAQAAVSRLTAAGVGAAVARTDLAALPHDPALAGLFEPIGGGSWAAASPWTFGE